MERVDDDRIMGLVDIDTGRPLPVQVDSRGRLCWLQDALKEGEVRTYKFAAGGFLGDVSRVVIREQEDGSADILQNERLIARYNGAAGTARPFLFPVLSPAGHEVTTDGGRDETAVGAAAHYRSCWCGWGDVSGVDHWTGGPGAGRQRHRRFTLSASGPVFGRVSALIEWLDHAGARQLCEQRVYTVYAYSAGYRIIDIISRLMMTDGPVTFGDTNDGGLCAVRVIPPLAPRGGGVLRNSNGETGAEECWGAAACWCDLTGQADDSFVGVAVMDCPGNVKYPTLWNATDDGLLAANPFGISSFLKDPSINGARTFEKDARLMLRYRLVIHDGSLTAEELSGLCDCFSQSLPIVVD